MLCRPHFIVPLLAALFPVACGSDKGSEPNTAVQAAQGSTPAATDTPANGDVPATGGLPSGSRAGADDGIPPTSNLPLLAAQNAPRPAGAAGNLKVLDWAGFKAAVSYTFDDSNRSQIAHYAALQALGVHMSFYLITSKPESLDPVWKQAVTDGHEVANHTQSHLQMGDNLAADTDAGNTFLKNTFGIEVYTMAAPYGAAAYSDIARARYLINRGVGDGQILPNGANDPFNLNCFIPPASAPASTFNGKIDAIRATGSWQTMLVHGFTDMDASEGAYQPVDFNEFVSGVNYAKAFGDVWIDSLLNVGAYWLGQKSFNATPAVVTGDTSTWTWTLPGHFPPGKYLRVTVDGGTLRQDGKALPWDPHGYYEVALDAKSLSLSP